MQVSFISTVFNEEKTIEQFLNSFLKQSVFPDEVVIVDGGSSDETVQRIKNYESRMKGKKMRFIILVKKGNRSVGRNEAIKHATGDIIVCSDAGNTLDKDWIKYIIQPFTEAKVDVVAGYYKGKATNVFQKCVIPYAFVMPDKVDPKSFLPATRSIAFTKKIWKKVGRFDEKLSHNEDYAFAHALKKANAKMVFKKEAIVYWMPRNTLKEAYIMFLRFAYGDAEASIFRFKVVLIIIRYMTGFTILILAIIIESVLLLAILLIALLAYTVWAISKNYKYVNHWQAFYILPLLQFTSDIAVLNGTVMGKLKVWDIQKKH